ncbi:MAG TPA: hypothetical protein EYO61_04595 [Campylobacterales bacterium]|nr:hypothetical protein [Campylobacterales bacterium]HIO70861.1 hypothetical protein [Campylobacterales bacterium]
MQPQILLPVLIFAIGMGIFLTNYLININDVEVAPPDTSREEKIYTKSELLQAPKNTETESSSWLEHFKTSWVKDYHYPVVEVSIKLPLNKKKEIHYFTLETEYLEPYQNFCVNQVLNRFSNVNYKMVESGDKIKFRIFSTNREVLETLKKEFENFEIETILK